MNDKELGAFFTPKKLVEFMILYIEDKMEYTDILEPSMGDGSFVKAFHDKKVRLDAVEIDIHKIDFEFFNKQENYEVYCNDFLDFTSSKKYDLIIGNPPYIVKSKLSSIQREKAADLVKKFCLMDSVVKNIWVLFLLKSIEFINNEGSIFFVLPYEFLMVDYAKKLRSLLEEKFLFINIVVFNEKAFPSIQQEVCLVFLSNSKKLKDVGRKPYISFEFFDKIDFKVAPIHVGKIIRNKPLDKWANSILTDDDIDFLMRSSNKFHVGKNLFTSKPGVVTAANKFFVVSKNTAEEYDFLQYTTDIISKSQIVGDKLIYSKDDHMLQINGNEKTKLLNLSGIKTKYFSSKLKKYLRFGKEQDINKRYKCTLRKRWYDVRVIEPGELIFFKRYHLYPRFIINESENICTDSGYNVYCKKNIDSKSLAFCFFNSLSLTMCEYYGRFYGGGVCELTPSEFKKIPIPYMEISTDLILELDRMLRSKVELRDIMKFVDSVVLGSTFSPQDLDRLFSIRDSLINRRIKNYN